MPTAELELINSISPPDVCIELNNGTGLYEWSFRCMSFEDHADEGFKTPVEALAHFTVTLIKLDDEMHLEEPEDDDSAGAEFWPDPYMPGSRSTDEEEEY